MTNDTIPTAACEPEDKFRKAMLDWHAAVTAHGLCSPTAWKHYDKVRAACEAAGSIPSEAGGWAEVVEDRLNDWRQRHMNGDGDRLALDDYMGSEAVEDLIDFVCAPIRAALAVPSEGVKP